MMKCSPDITARRGVKATLVRIWRPDATAVCRSLNNIFSMYGTRHATALNVSTLNTTIETPKPKPIYVLPAEKKFEGLCGIFEWFEKNNGSLVKGWLLTKPKGTKLWQNEIAITQDKVSLNGSVHYTGTIRQGLKFLFEQASLRIRDWNNWSDMRKAGLLLWDKVPGSSIFTPRSWQNAPGSRLIFRSGTSMGLVKVTDVMRCLENAFADDKNPVMEVAVFQPTLWGFDRGLTVERCMDGKGGYFIQFEIAPVSTEIQGHVVKSLTSAL